MKTWLFLFIALEDTGIERLRIWALVRPKNGEDQTAQDSEGLIVIGA